MDTTKLDEWLEKQEGDLPNREARLLAIAVDITEEEVNTEIRKRIKVTNRLTTLQKSVEAYVERIKGFKDEEDFDYADKMITMLFDDLDKTLRETKEIK